MKKRRMTGLLLALPIAFLSLPAFAEEMPLGHMDGVNWYTSEQEMRIIEGLPEEELAEGTIVGDYLRYGFLHYEDIPYASYTIYMYRNDLLVLYGTSADAFLQADEILMKNVFHEYLQSLGAVYGIPGMTDERRVINVFNAIEPDALSMEDVVAFAGWDVDEDTTLLLVQLENEYVDAVYTLYVNEARLFADGE